MTSGWRGQHSGQIIKSPSTFAEQQKDFNFYKSQTQPFLKSPSLHCFRGETTLKCENFCSVHPKRNHQEELLGVRISSGFEVKKAPKRTLKKVLKTVLIGPIVLFRPGVLVSLLISGMQPERGFKYSYSQSSIPPTHHSHGNQRIFLEIDCWRKQQGGCLPIHDYCIDLVFAI